MCPGGTEVLKSSSTLTETRVLRGVKQGGAKISKLGCVAGGPPTPVLRGWSSLVFTISSSEVGVDRGYWAAFHVAHIEAGPRSANVRAAWRSANFSKTRCVYKCFH